MPFVLKDIDQVVTILNRLAKFYQHGGQVGNGEIHSWADLKSLEE